jgi:hypothetical protein
VENAVVTANGRRRQRANPTTPQLSERRAAPDKTIVKAWHVLCFGTRSNGLGAFTHPLYRRARRHRAKYKEIHMRSHRGSLTILILALLVTAFVHEEFPSGVEAQSCPCVCDATRGRCAVEGNSTICSEGATLELHNVPANVTVRWTAQPAYLFANSSGTGASALLTARGYSGLAQITFHVTSGCGEERVSRSIWVGLPDATGISIVPDRRYMDPSGCLPEWTQYRNRYGVQLSSHMPGADLYRWVEPALGWNEVGLPEFQFDIPNTAPDHGAIVLLASGENDCGSGTVSAVYPFCSYYFLYGRVARAALPKPAEPSQSPSHTVIPR